MPVLKKYNKTDISKAIKDICQFIYGVVFLIVKLKLKAVHEQNDNLNKQYDDYVAKIGRIHEKWGNLIKHIKFTDIDDVIEEEDFMWDSDANNKKSLDELITQMDRLLKDGKVNYTTFYKFIQFKPKSFRSSKSKRRKNNE